MHTTTRLSIQRSQIATTRIDTSDAALLLPGQARLQIERLAITANNISYAATGDLLQYWQFFPVDATWGSLPAWGFAHVTETQCDALLTGERFWGFWPLASELVVQPVKATAHGFTDGIAHRTKLPSIYNEYLRCSQDAMHRDGFEDVEALLRPLFSTGWLVDDFFFDQQFFGAEVAVISSALKWWGSQRSATKSSCARWAATTGCWAMTNSTNCRRNALRSTWTTQATPSCDCSCTRC